MTFYNLFKNKSENNNEGVIHKGCPHKGGGRGSSTKRWHMQIRGEGR